jgi:hypothetical protein
MGRVTRPDPLWGILDNARIVEETEIAEIIACRDRQRERERGQRGEERSTRRREVTDSRPDATRSISWAASTQFTSVPSEPGSHNIESQDTAVGVPHRVSLNGIKR